MEEGKAEKQLEKRQSGASWLGTPMSEFKEKSPRVGAFSLRDSAIMTPDPLPCSPLASKQGSSLHSTVSWDTSQLEALSQNSSDIIHFSIAHETFPDAENDGSFNCSDGSQEVEELLLPPVRTCSPETETILQISRSPLDESPFTGRFKEIKSDFVPSTLKSSPGLGSFCGEKIFSLDLDQLESFSSPCREETTLPNLVTFSPMDEL